MDRERWTHSFTHAYERLSMQLEYPEHTATDPYAATSPAEFFAVVTEYFFEAPETLHEAFPAVYEELRAFYRQAPLSHDYRR